jgi:hypothetical protein
MILHPTSRRPLKKMISILEEPEEQEERENGQVVKSITYMSNGL